MMHGVVSPTGDAVVPLRFLGPDSQKLEVEVVVDTGFNDYLTLPSDLIAALSIPYYGEVEYFLADGSESLARVFEATVEWFGRPRRVLVLEVDCTPLLGVEMLRGSRLTIEVAPNGRVIIEPLTNPTRESDE